MQHSTEPSRLLFGYRGWPLSWDDYFPEDLPADWKMGYYSNDCSCLVLPASVWLKMDDDEVGDWLDEVSEDFRFYFEMPKIIINQSLIDRFQPHVGALLGAAASAEIDGIQSWSALSEGVSIDKQAKVKIFAITLVGKSLREVKAELQQMPDSVEVLLVADAQTHPRELVDIRTLAELLGVA